MVQCQARTAPFAVWLLVALVMTVGHVTVALAQTMPLRPADPNFGPGKIPSSQARNNIGRVVTACGLVSNVNHRLRSMNVGEPGVGGSYGAHLIVILPSDAGLDRLFGKTVCVTGRVEQGASGAPTIRARDSQDVEIMGPSSGPQQGCAPHEHSTPDGRCVPWRAPYGGMPR